VLNCRIKVQLVFKNWRGNCKLEKVSWRRKGVLCPGNKMAKGLEMRMRLAFALTRRLAGCP
jgi:hypothetical protein